MDAAEVPCAVGAMWADPSNYRSRERSTYSLVVIHITDGHADARPVAEMWQEKGHGTSAHFVVGQDGTVIQCVHLKDAAQHAHSANAYSVGIEHCARSPKELSHDDPGLPPSEELYLASAKLVVYLCRAAGLAPTRDNIKGHAEADPHTTHEDCPTGNWDWDHYMACVAEADAALGATNAG